LIDRTNGRGLDFEVANERARLLHLRARARNETNENDGNENFSQKAFSKEDTFRLLSFTQLYKSKACITSSLKECSLEESFLDKEESKNR
jgi:hypothetical protein